ncbi:hypothetical protein [Paenibacillus wenxiniae]|uniref:DUF2785 domain-containing protein n=1 Tax=Paenibacillus wenxiniae TaxID=1636843 RepID=A0ABW4RN73_9BACL
MDTNILANGLRIIAHSKSVTGDIWEAHFGAAAIAAYFFTEENKLAVDTVNCIQLQVEKMLVEKSYTTTPYSATQIQMEQAEELILQSLSSVMDDLHWVGHNVIYTALSLQAIRELDGWGIESDIQGICVLIESFKRTIPGRSWLGYSVAEVKRLMIEASDRFPVITNAQQLSSFVLNELASFRTIYRAEAHHDLIGHMLTFSHALNILFDLGYSSYAQQAMPSLFKLIKALRATHDLQADATIRLNSPIDHLPLVKATRSSWLPLEREYWSTDYAPQDWDFGHVFKFPYSFYNHLNRIDVGMAKAVENFRYIICSESK